jgi:hypothetical protein
MSTLVSITELDNGSSLSRFLYDDGSFIDKQNIELPTVSNSEIAAAAEINGREWRDLQLKKSDHIPAITDHPQRAAYLSYRTALRDWPSTSDFPATKPTLGS